MFFLDKYSLSNSLFYSNLIVIMFVPIIFFYYLPKFLKLVKNLRYIVLQLDTIIFRACVYIEDETLFAMIGLEFIRPTTSICNRFRQSSVLLFFLSMDLEDIFLIFFFKSCKKENIGIPKNLSIPILLKSTICSKFICHSLYCHKKVGFLLMLFSLSFSSFLRRFNQTLWVQYISSIYSMGLISLSITFHNRHSIRKISMTYILIETIS